MSTKVKLKPTITHLIQRFMGIGILVILSAGCNFFTNSELISTQQSNNLEISHTETATIQPSFTPMFFPSPTITITSTITPTPTPTEPDGCLKPEDNYELLTVNGMLLNQRTFSMLDHAQTLYGGELEITGYHLTQGSYTNEVSASFGTHAGGGAVDLSVIRYGIYEVLYDDIDPLISALRTAGFAAWLRNFDQLYPGSPIHIHAIAIGDRDLSPAAQDQLTGKFGYFAGFNGLPQPEGVAPVQDEHGGPIVCQWMLELGYVDMRTPIP